MTATLPAADPAVAREQYRAGLAVSSSGWAPGYTQANLVVLPRDWAYDMLLFAQRNPKPCPVLDVTDPGGVRSVLAPGADRARRSPATASGRTANWSPPPPTRPSTGATTWSPS